MPLLAPGGTKAMIWKAEMTLNEAALPLNVTPVALLNLFPRIITGVLTCRMLERFSRTGRGPQID
jgi:hypothetical protein